ncbi:MAG: ABC transporter substrate-binding protein [Oscillospiraceae bacterium]|nr:ABC transporter substrate-binding protein [Oscillospiraceae bacterium]
MKMRKILSLAVVFVMLFTFLAACGGDGDDTGTVDPSGDPGVRYETKRPLEVGIWWNPDDIYDSNRTTIPASEKNQMMGEIRLANMRAIENRYNITLKFVDITYNGAKESISTSIMAGSPDMDIYCMDLNFGIPYIMGDYCLPIDSYARPGSDIFTTQNVMSSLNVCGLDKDYIMRAAPFTDYNAIFMLGYNWDILQEFNQPNPQALWDEGKWTWDAWLDIMKATTDSNRGTFGWGGAHVSLLDNLLISNNANIALTDTQGLTSANTLEVLDFIYKMYNEHNVAKPWDGDIEYWDNNDWSGGTNAFFVWIAWLAQRNGVSKGFGTETDPACDYTIRVVPWPLGPTVNSKDEVKGTNVKGNVYMIPKGVQDPFTVYDIWFDYNNWHGGDLELRNEQAFWMQDLFADDVKGFQFCQELGEKPQFDMWEPLNAKNADSDTFGIGGIIGGTAMPSELSEQWKNVMQDAIDKAYGK